MAGNTSVQAQNPKETIGEIIKSCQERFNQFDQLDYKTEALFASQLCERNDYLARIALSNPNSLRMAVLNLAAVGLSLNPATGLAYLVPRQGRVILDISYRGLIALAVDSDAIKWAKPVLVYTNDSFVFKGPAVMPEHECDPFLSESERGDVRGGYCVAKLPCGDLMVDTMSRATMEKIRAASPAGQNADGPWVNWEDQMQLKTLVKRASKHWPQTSKRFGEALRIINEDNGEGLSKLSVLKFGDVVQGDNVVSLPAPKERAQITVETLELVEGLMGRAMANGAFEAAKDIARERITDRGELAFAYHELEHAAERYRQQIAEVKQAATD